MLAAAFGGLAAAKKDSGSWRAADPGDLFFAGSLAMHLLWPWWYDRYWLPLLPFLASALATGIGSWLPRRGERATALALSAFLAWQFAAQGRLWLRPGPDRLRPELSETYAWIRANSSPADGFASLFYARDLLYTGRVFGPPPEADSAAGLRDALARRRQRYVLWQDAPDLGFSLATGGSSRPLALGRLLEDPSAFRLVHADARSGARLYEVLTK
jgi:hypothetical protein